MGNQRISDLTPLASGSLAKNLNVIPVVSGNETYQTTLTDLQSDIQAKSLQVTGSTVLAYNETIPGVWSAGGALSSPRYRTPGGAGDKNSALAFGGYTYSSYVITGDTEAYDGSSWSAANPMITPRNNLAGFGSQDAAVAVGGNSCRQPWRFAAPNVMSCTEEYNGATWTVGGALSSTPYGRNGLSAVGTQNAGLAFGGYPEYVTPQTEKYDGSAWSAAAALNSTRYNSAGAGTQNAALMFGGASANTPDYYTTCTEAYDGTTWSVQTGLSIGRYYLGGSGTQNATLAFGGYSSNCGYESCTERWDGTAWSADTALSNGRYSLGSTGNSTGNSIAFGGVNWDGSGTYCMNCTEEYADPYIVQTPTLTYDPLNGLLSSTGSFTGSLSLTDNLSIPNQLAVTGSAVFAGGLTGSGNFNIDCNASVGCTTFNNFSAGPNLIQARGNLAGAGTQNAGLVFGGRCVSVCNLTEEYDGSAWSAGGTLITGRQNLAGLGTQNSALGFGGIGAPSFAATSCTEEYDGSTWSTGGALITSRFYANGTGLTFAALSIGGTAGSGGPSAFTCTEEYNGTAWSAISPLNTARTTSQAAGFTNAAISFGGTTFSPSTGFSSTTCTEEYDGVSWSAGSSMVLTHNSHSGTGAQTSAVSTRGTSPTNTTTELYDGLHWSIGTDLPTSNGFCSTAILGDSKGVVIAGGYCAPGFLGNTYESTNYNICSPTSTINPIGGTSFKGNTKLISFINPKNVWYQANGTLNTPRSWVAAAGSTYSTLVFGGNPSSSGGISTEKYDGVSWTVTANLINKRTNGQAGAGTQNAASALAGASYSPNVVLSCTEEYNGSTWSEGGALITPRTRHSGTGTQNSTLLMGGCCSFGNTTSFNCSMCTEEYDGASWSAGGALINARVSGAGAGTQNAGLMLGGWNNPSPIARNLTEEYDGSSWSAGGTLIGSNDNIYLAASGYQNSAIAVGGSSGPSANVKRTQEYDGSTWSLGSDLLFATQCSDLVGNQSSALEPKFMQQYTGGADIETTFEHTDTGRLVFAQISSSLDFASDSAAAAGGVPLGGIYRNGGDIKIRLV